MQYQQRSEGLTDSEVLELAANEVKVSDLSQAENDALTIFQDRLSNLKDLQEKRTEQARLYKEQQFGAKPDRAEASYMRGIDAPVITRVLEIDIYDETLLSDKRSEIYEAERQGIQQKTSAIFTRYDSFDFRNKQRKQQRSNTQNVGYNDQFGSERGRGSKTASRVKEYLFDDEGNVISQKYSRELDFIDYINENSDVEEYKPISNRTLLANVLESTAQNDIELKRLTQYKKNR